MESIDTLLTRTADGLQDTSEVGTKQQKRKRKKNRGDKQEDLLRIQDLRGEKSTKNVI
jgi:hypothetical protein